MTGNQDEIRATVNGWRELLEASRWPRYPQRIECSMPTLDAIKRASVAASDAAPSFMPAPPVGVPVIVDQTVPDGRARITWQDGTTELIP